MVGTYRERIISSISNELDTLFVSMHGVEQAHYIMHSRATNLDNIGLLLSTARIYLESDESYRERLLQVISINAAASTKYTIGIYLATYLNIDVNLISVEENIASASTVYIRLPDTYATRNEEIREKLHDIAAAGIFIRFIFDDNNWDEAEWDNTDYTWGN